MVNLPAISGDTWLNSKPLSHHDLLGKVVLVDFWTYTCVNCARTIPFIRRWWEKYKDTGLVIIGIHSPEFEFEKKLDNVKQAVRDLGVTWPVVLDNDFTNWNNFANRYWPAKYLADRDGHIVYQHFGEGSYKETEKKIIELLGEVEGESTKEDLEIEEHQHGSFCFPATPETYIGYGRGRLTSGQDYAQDTEHSYEAPEEIDNDTIALSGKFIANKQYVQSVGEDNQLLLNFKATEVNLVLHPTNGSSRIELTLDNEPLPKKFRGETVDEHSQLMVSKPAMYNLIRASELVRGTLGIRALSGNFQAYAFTFSGCTDHRGS